MGSRQVFENPSYNVEENAGNEAEIIELSDHILDILRQIDLALPIPLVRSSPY